MGRCILRTNSRTSCSTSYLSDTAIDIGPSWTCKHAHVNYGRVTSNIATALSRNATIASCSQHSSIFSLAGTVMAEGAETTPPTFTRDTYRYDHIQPRLFTGAQPAAPNAHRYKRRLFSDAFAWTMDRVNTLGSDMYGHTGCVLRDLFQVLF